jgi:hypothetical protein
MGVNPISSKIGQPGGGLTRQHGSPVMSTPSEAKSKDSENLGWLGAGQVPRGQSPWSSKQKGLGFKEQSCWGKAWVLKVRREQAREVPAGIPGGRSPRRWPRPAGCKAPRKHSLWSQGLVDATWDVRRSGVSSRRVQARKRATLRVGTPYGKVWKWKNLMRQQPGKEFRWGKTWGRSLQRGEGLL